MCAEKVYHKWGTEEYYEQKLNEAKTYEVRYYWHVCRALQRRRKVDEVPAGGRVTFGTDIDWDNNTFCIQAAEIEELIVKARYSELVEERKKRRWYTAEIISNFCHETWPRNIYVVKTSDCKSIIAFTGRYGTHKMTKEEAKKNLKLGKPLEEKASASMWESYDYSFTY